MAKLPTRNRRGLTKEFMKAQHTPGPWKWDGNPCEYDEQNEAPWLVDDQDNYPPVLGGAIKCANTANARLIAAAPDLLEALESAWLWMENQADGQSKGGHATFDLMMLREQRDIARAAIAKANGGAV